MREIRILNPYQNQSKSFKKNIKDKILTDKLRIFMNNFFSSIYSLSSPKMPLAIEIETLNKCNNDCPFCPVNKTIDPRPFQRMPDQLIERIANELGERNYNGLIGLFSNNEPLLDTRIFEICRLFRKRVPGAYIYIYTNGIVINTDSYLRLFDEGLDELVIDNYSDDLNLLPSVQELVNGVNKLDSPSIERYKAKTTIVLRKKNEVLTNRGGIAPNKSVERFDKYKIFTNGSCVLPFVQMVVRPSGKVSMCCQDAHGQGTLGDISIQSIYEIWNGKVYKEIREKLKKEGRKSIPLCSNCDVSIWFKSLIKKKFFDILRLNRARFTVLE